MVLPMCKRPNLNRSNDIGWMYIRLLTSSKRCLFRRNFLFRNPYWSGFGLKFTPTKIYSPCGNPYRSGFGLDFTPDFGFSNHDWVWIWFLFMESGLLHIRPLWSGVGLDLVPILGIITIIGGLDFTPDFGLFGQDLVWIWLLLMESWPLHIGSL